MKLNTADYTEIRGTIIKKKHTIFGRCYLYIADRDRTVNVTVGKGIFDLYSVGIQLTVGYIGHKLINIRPGIVANEETLTGDKR